MESAIWLMSGRSGVGLVVGVCGLLGGMLMVREDKEAFDWERGNGGLQHVH